VTRRIRRKIVRAALAIVVLLIALRVWPHDPLSARVALSTSVWSADGELLRVTLASDEQYRLWTPLKQVAPALVEAMLLKEDRWFYWHPGVNPVALGRAAMSTYGAGERQGGSTLTMQLARLLYRLNTRSPVGKLRQIAIAVWLECRYSKRELLEAYLNVAPFGGNIEGVGAASRIYFGKPPDRLTLGESLTLAVIPQRPATRAGRTTSEASLLAARAKLGKQWLDAHGNADADRRQIELPIVARPDYTLPWLAPHFVDALLRGDRSAGRRQTTTLDAGLQRVLETQMRRYLNERKDTGVRNAATLLVDTRDMAVKAWIGSANYWAPGEGQVNGVVAKRSPGSTLKPFVYALAVDQGVAHPKTVVRDAPSAFGPFTPENFDGRFVGPITLEDALIRSRNVPAVWAANQLRQPSFYEFLRSAGVRDMKSEAFYGLGLALGNGEVTMEELAALYAMLANGGMLRPLRVDASARVADEVRLLSPEASFVTLDMLRHNPRPDDTGMAAGRARWPVAWKTGTSFGFRDAWSAGVVGPYVLVVWIGNFTGEGNPAFVGVDAAAPLFFRMVDALNLARPVESLPSIAPPAGVSRVAVCAGSGDLPNADCPRTVDTWYIPGKSPIRVSQLHRRVAIDQLTGRPVCAPFPAGTRFEVFEFWSSDMLTLFREAGMPRRTPPALPACAAENASDAPRLASPMRNVAYAVRPGTAQDSIALDAGVAADVRRVFWFDGNSLIGLQNAGAGPLAWRPSTPGIHLVRVVDDRGRSAERQVEVTIVGER
jgi:penicillin-binding protein 1C